MIRYDGGRYQLSLVLQIGGSVFPDAAALAAGPAIIAAVFSWLLTNYPEWFPEGSYPSEKEFSLFSTFSWVVGFILVFRTSQSYGRYWEGAQLLHAVTTEWYDACAQIIGFAAASCKNDEELKAFSGTTIRLFSILHCSALQQVTVMNDDRFHVIDAKGLDKDLRRFLRNYDLTGTQEERRQKTEIIFQWITRFVLEAINYGTITTPPPIVTRAFQELNSGMTALNRMMTVTDTPFPFPYVQMISMLLLIYMLLTPFIIAPQASHWAWSGLFTFVAVFTQWAINLIASEIEQPFGDDLNDFDLWEIQDEMNSSLLLLMEPSTQAVPKAIPINEKSTHRLSVSQYHEAPDFFHNDAFFGSGSAKMPAGTRSQGRWNKKAESSAQVVEEEVEEAPSSQGGIYSLVHAAPPTLQRGGSLQKVRSRTGSLPQGRVSRLDPVEDLDEEEVTSGDEIEDTKSAPIKADRRSRSQSLGTVPAVTTAPELPGENVHEAEEGIPLKGKASEEIKKTGVLPITTGDDSRDADPEKGEARVLVQSSDDRSTSDQLEQGGATLTSARPGCSDDSRSREHALSPDKDSEENVPKDLVLADKLAPQPLESASSKKEQFQDPKPAAEAHSVGPLGQAAKADEFREFQMYQEFQEWLKWRRAMDQQYQYSHQGIAGMSDEPFRRGNEKSLAPLQTASPPRLPFSQESIFATMGPASPRNVATKSTPLYSLQRSEAAKNVEEEVPLWRPEGRLKHHNVPHTTNTKEGSSTSSAYADPSSPQTSSERHHGAHLT